MADRTYTCSVCGDELNFPPDEFQCRLGRLYITAVTAPGQRAAQEALDGGAGMTAALEASEAATPDALVLAARYARAKELRDLHPVGTLTAERAWTMAEAEMN